MTQREHRISLVVRFGVNAASEEEAIALASEWLLSLAEEGSAPAWLSPDVKWMEMTDALKQAVRTEAEEHNSGGLLVEAGAAR